MNSITQEAKFRQQVVEYTKKHSKTAIRFRVSRQSIWRWEKRYDGAWQSLQEKSHRPHHSPNGQTKEEVELIKRQYPYYSDMMMLWDRLCEKGYKRCYQSMIKAIKRLGLKKDKGKRTGRKPKPYQRADYPGQKVQADIKFVSSAYVTDGKKYCQYTAIDECTRFCFREMYDEHSTCSSPDFLKKLIKAYPFTIREIQTDNGTE